MKYIVTIQEVLERTEEVNANSPQEAESIIRERYRNCDIVLDSGDYVRTKIEVHENEL